MDTMPLECCVMITCWLTEWHWTYLSHACALAGFHSTYFSYRVRHLAGKQAQYRGEFA
jgi:hypothetical protein